MSKPKEFWVNEETLRVVHADRPYRILVEKNAFDELQTKYDKAIAALKYAKECEHSLKVFHGNTQYKQMLGHGLGVIETLNELGEL